MVDDMYVPTIVWLIIGLLILLNALIILSNTALNNVNVTIISQLSKEEDNKGARAVVKLLERQFKYRYSNRVINYLISIFSMVLLYCSEEKSYYHILVFFLLLATLGDLIPRKIALAHSDSLAIKLATFQRIMLIISFPLVIVLTYVSDFILKVFRQETKVEISSFSEDQIMSMLEAGQQSGEIKEEGKKMINSIFQFDDELAYEIMTPRTDVFLIDIKDPASEYIDELMELRYSRIPVCEDEPDNIIGILHIKDYLIQARKKGFENVNIRNILRKPYLVPETKNIDSLFFELQKEKQHIAILIDEYGGFSGIVTMEDIIEEVMGEIDDEYDREELAVKEISPNTYIVSGKVSLSDLDEEYNIHLESENSETIGGFLIDLLGEIPAESDKNRVIEYNNYTFTILSVKERRVEKVKVHINELSKEEEIHGKEKE